MKIKNLVLALLGVSLLGACSKGEVYVPKVGGAIDTLHNEIHVANASVFEDPKFIAEAEAGKIYITDSDGFKYTFDPMTNTFVLAEKTDTIINFYFDASQTTRFVDVEGEEFQAQIDAPIYVAYWYKLKPLNEAEDKAPDEIDTQEEVEALGNIYGFHAKENTIFVGWSLYPSCLGDYDHLWHFNKDFKQQAVTNLYGIWVEE